MKSKLDREKQTDRNSYEDQAREREREIKERGTQMD